jgi:feruloyl esterase
VLQCQGADETSCLTPAQVQTTRMLYATRVNPKAKREVAGLQPGSELGWTDRGWSASARATGLDQFRFLVFKDPRWDIEKFNVDTDIAHADKADNDTINALDPDLGAFISRGGRLIQYHGWSDPQISPANSVHYKRVLSWRRGQGSGGYRPFGSGHGALRRGRGSEHVRHGHRAGAMVEQGQR